MNSKDAARELVTWFTTSLILAILYTITHWQKVGDYIIYYGPRLLLGFGIGFAVGFFLPRGK